MTLSKTAQYKILVVDDSPTILEMVKSWLEVEGYEVGTAMNGVEALEKAKSFEPDLILLDIEMPQMDGYEVCEQLRDDIKTGHIPIIMLTSRAKVEDKIAGLGYGADDYMTKPFDSRELVARIQANINRTRKEKMANPLTGLPGNIQIENKIRERIASGSKFAVMYLDVDDFKSFNDFYGFSQGDQVIRLVADIVTSTIREKGNQNDFIGHIGGDDFIVTTTLDRVNSICQEIIKKFDNQIPSLYKERDRKKGCIVTKDRQGKKCRRPIMTISIAVVTNEKRELTSIGMVSEIGAEIKRYLKQVSRSNYLVDRRKE